MRVLGGRIVLVEGQSRKRPAGHVQEHARSGPSSSSGASSHHHDDRPRPPARLHSPLEVALRDGPTRATVAAAVPRVDARFHLGGKSSAGGRRGSGEVSARTEMIHMAVFAVRGSDRLNGLRTARTAIWIIAVRVSHHDLHVLRTGRVVGHNMARFHRPLTCTAPLPGEYASSALASPSKRVRREIARAAAGSEVVCT
jgi:hypothetical protein